MPHNQKSAADQVAEAKAKAAGILYVKRTLEDMEDGKVCKAPNKPTEPPAKRASSPSQIAANKANGLLSTGPRTPEGKAKVSANALKHGLRGERNPLDVSTTIPGEQTQFESTLAGFTARFRPDDDVELHLVQRLAQVTLRLNRAAQMETALTDQAHASATDWIDNHPGLFPDPAQHPTEVLAGTWTRSAKETTLISHYESRLSRDFARTLRQLLQLQKLRKQSQPVLKPKEEAPTPQHSGTGSSVPSDANTSFSDEQTRARVDIGACPPTNPQPPNEPKSPSEILTKQTQTPPTPRQPPAISNQTNPTPPLPTDQPAL